MYDKLQVALIESLRRASRLKNPTNGSWWFVQILSTTRIPKTLTRARTIFSCQFNDCSRARRFLLAAYL